MLNLWAILYSEKYYPNPEEFRPERWDEPVTATQPFYPFGIGSRTCFGQKLATTEVKVFISLLLDKFDVLIDETKYPEFEFEFGIAPKGRSLYVKLRRLEQ